MTSPATAWLLGNGRELALDRTRLMGILNATPDSFSDGGRYDTVDAAVEAGLAMAEAGASIIDVGGESTRPGAEAVSSEEQIRRTVPVIQGIRDRSTVPISIDTTCSGVASAALDAGADAINDVSGGMDDPGLLRLAASRGCGLVLMHRLRPPGEESFSDAYDDSPVYRDVVMDVLEVLCSLATRAEAVGVDRRHVMIDPGLGFGKTVEQNWLLIARIRSFLSTGYPVLGAASRKSFIGAVMGADDPKDRVAASVAVACWMAAMGVQVIRVHDVQETATAMASVSKLKDSCKQLLEEEQVVATLSAFQAHMTSDPARGEQTWPMEQYST